MVKLTKKGGIDVFFFKSKKQPRVGGTIAELGLENWWLNEFTEEEREIIRNKFKPMNQTKDFSIDQGKEKAVSRDSFSFLTDLAGWFSTSDLAGLGEKMLDEAEQMMTEKTPILDQHFFWQQRIKTSYVRRDTVPTALNRTIGYCEKQIELSEKAKGAFFNDGLDHLPAHIGYKQLAIILEKQGELEKALEITKKAEKQGWNNDNLKRIERLQKKLNKKGTTI